MTNINKMLKQAQKMQKEVECAQSKLAQKEVNFSSNGVSIVARGDFTFKSISISDDLIESGDKDMIEDVVLVAMNGAVAEVRKMTESKLSGIVGGLEIPGLF